MMKKTTAFLVAALASSSVFADIDVELKNIDSSGSVYKSGGGTIAVNQAYVQLVWSPTNTAQANITDSQLLGAGEYLLNEVYSSAGAAGRFPSQGILTYTDADVGNNNINAGFFFVRIYDYDAAVISEGDFYLQQYVQGPTLTEYDTAPAPRPIAYNTDGSLGGALDDTNVGGGNVVIPEPAVASLIGIFGVGLLFGRRIFGKN